MAEVPPIEYIVVKKPKDGSIPSIEGDRYSTRSKAEKAQDKKDKPNEYMIIEARG